MMPWCVGLDGWVKKRVTVAGFRSSVDQLDRVNDV